LKTGRLVALDLATAPNYCTKRLAGIFHSVQLAGIRALRKGFCMNGLRFSNALGRCEISQNILLAGEKQVFSSQLKSHFSSTQAYLSW